MVVLEFESVKTVPQVLPLSQVPSGDRPPPILDRHQHSVHGHRL